MIERVAWNHEIVTISKRFRSILLKNIAQLSKYVSRSNKFSVTKVSNKSFAVSSADSNLSVNNVSEKSDTCCGKHEFHVTKTVGEVNIWKLFLTMNFHKRTKNNFPYTAEFLKKCDKNFI